MTFCIQKLTKKSIAATSKSWKAIAGEDAYNVELKNVFDIVSANINYNDSSNNTAVVYGIFNSTAKEASAFVEVIQTKKARGGITKMLKLWTSPIYWDIEVHRNELSKIYIAALNQTIQLGNEHKHKLVKIYGRNDYMMVILNAIYNLLSGDIREGKLQGTKVYFEGKWLTFSTEA